MKEDKKKKVSSIKEEDYDLEGDDIFVVPSRRSASTIAAQINSCLLGTGGYFDSQTGDTQFFEEIPETPQPGNSSPSVKTSCSVDLSKKKTRSPPSQTTPTPVHASIASLSRTPSTDPATKRKHAEMIHEECDGELERRIEDAMIELGRLRTLADAKTVEINVLISQRFSRLKSVLVRTQRAHVHEDRDVSPSASEKRRRVDEDPYIPSLETQIHNAIVKDYEPLGHVESEVLGH